MSRDAWTCETPEEKARRLMRLNDYANAVAACQMAFEKINKLGKTRKPEKEEEKHEEPDGTQGRG